MLRHRDGRTAKGYGVRLAVILSAVAVLALVASPTTYAQGQASETAQASETRHAEACTNFTVWYDLFNRITGHPNFEAAGLKKMSSLYEGSWWPKGGTFNESNLRNSLKTKARENPTHLQVDIEQHQVHKGNAEAAANQRVYLRIAQIIREELPQVKFGWYGNASIANANHALVHKGDVRHIEQVKADDDRKVPVIRVTDFMTTNLYTLDDKHPKWLSAAKFKAAEAKRVSPNKPLYPYLKYVYNFHDASFAWQPIPKARLKAQMKDLLGIVGYRNLVFWEGADRNWGDKDEERQFWPAVTEFIRENNLCRP